MSFNGLIFDFSQKHWRCSVSPESKIIKTSKNTHRQNNRYHLSSPTLHELLIGSLCNSRHDFTLSIGVEESDMKTFIVFGA